MINYDVPWNPARLEQRMGRIHRYGQKHDPVIILNLVAGKTREGRVLKTLLDKLERIRKELRSDKVFDVVGRLFENVPLTDYMTRALNEAGADAASSEIEGLLTEEQVEAIEAREKALYGEGGEVGRELPRLRAQLGDEVYRRLAAGVRPPVRRAGCRCAGHHHRRRSGGHLRSPTAPRRPTRSALGRPRIVSARRAQPPDGTPPRGQG